MKTLKSSPILSLAVATVVAAMTGTSFSQVLFSENFDVDPTASWTVNKPGANLTTVWPTSSTTTAWWAFHRRPTRAARRAG